MLKQKNNGSKGKLEIQKLKEGQVETLDEWNNTFFSTEASFNFDGRYITIDFMRRSPRAKQGKYVEVVEHNTIMLDIFHSKVFAEKFSGLMNALEKQFGNVEAPEFMKKIQSETQAQIKKALQDANQPMEGLTAKNKDAYIG